MASPSPPSVTRALDACKAGGNMLESRENILKLYDQCLGGRAGVNYANPVYGVAIICHQVR